MGPSRLAVVCLSAGLAVLPARSADRHPIERPDAQAGQKPEAGRGDPARPASAPASPSAAAAAPQAARPATVDTTVPRPKEPFTPSVQKSPRTGKSVVVITNSDLEKMFGRPAEDEDVVYGGADPAPATASGPARPAQGPAGIGGAPPPRPGPAPRAAAPRAPQGAHGDDEAAAAPGGGGGAADPAARAAEIERELQRLDQKAKHLRNPFTRPAPQSEAERAAERNLDTAQRLQKTQDEMQKLQGELDRLKSSPGPSGSGD